MKKWIFCLITLLFVFLTTGCISYTELNELGIVGAIGIHYEDKQVVLSLQFIDAKKEENNSSYQTTLLVGTGNDMESAIDMIYQQSSRSVYFSHVAFMVLDESCQGHFQEIVSYFLKQEELRSSFPVVFLNQEITSEFFDLSDITFRLPSLLTVNHEEHATTLQVSFEDMARQYLEEESVLLPVFQADSSLMIDGAIWISNDTMIRFSKEEVMGILFLQDDIEQMELTIREDTETKKIRVLAETTILNITPMHLDIEIHSQIRSVDFPDATSFQKAYEDTVQSYIAKVLDQLNADHDFLHFKTVLFREDPKSSDDLIQWLNHFTYSFSFHTSFTSENSSMMGGDLK